MINKMKKKDFFYAAMMAVCMAFSMSACSEEDNPTPDPGVDVDPYDLNYTADNASAWGNYMYQTALLLDQDATSLYDAWRSDYDGQGPYATIFKDQTTGAYSSPLACIQEMVQLGMWNIANEVGDAKIRDPYDKYVGGDQEGGLYAVESWFSWHSRDDYTNTSSPSVTPTTDGLTTTMWIKSMVIWMLIVPTMILTTKAILQKTLFPSWLLL